MPIAVGVVFKRVSQAYWFDPGDLLDLKEDDRVVVETTQGLDLGTVSFPPQEVHAEDLGAPLKPILRRATPEDLEREQQNEACSKEAFSLCKQLIRQQNLPMKLAHAEYNFEGTQVTFLFTSEGRVDFRDLVKELGHTLRCRVMFYQVGARDQAKVVGGIGPCGLTTCCSTFLTGFKPVTMKMAKDQSLFLNPVKFSGMCGKLMCCLRYEQEMYVESRARLPRIGSLVQTPVGPARVMDLFILKEEVVVETEGDRQTFTFKASELRWADQPRGGKCGICSRRLALEFRSARLPTGKVGDGSGQGCRTNFAPLQDEEEEPPSGERSSWAGF